MSDYNVAVINGNLNTTIVVNYAPIEGSKEAEEHYNNLINLINSISKHHMVIECGDFNSHLGKESVQHTYHELTNNNGKLLLEYATSSNLIITNTMFTK